MKKSGRKLLGILLAASMAVTTVFPMQGFAAEGNGYEEAEEALAEGTAAGSSEEVQQPTDESANPEVTGEVQQPTDESANPETQDGEQQPAEEGTNPEAVNEEKQEPAEEGRNPETQDGEQPPADGTQPEGTEEKQEPAEEAGLENLEEGQDPAEERQDPAEEGTEPETLGEQQKPSDGAQPAEEEQGTEGAEMGTFMLPQRNGEDGIMPLEDKADIDAPVIEDFEFKENGQTLTRDDILHFSMLAYDADSGIKTITVELNCGVWKTVQLRKSEEKNRYEGSISCSVFEGKNGYISCGGYEWKLY